MQWFAHFPPINIKGDDNLDVSDFIPPNIRVHQTGDFLGIPIPVVLESLEE